MKTLQDQPRLLPIKRTTVATLTRVKPPNPIPDTRLPFERRIFQVTAGVVLVRAEDDSDYHIVVQSGRAQMIAESPLPACAPRASRDEDIAPRQRLLHTRHRLRAQARAASEGKPRQRCRQGVHRA